MAIKVGAQVVRRPSLPLTQQDESGLALVRESEAYRDALVRITGTQVDVVSLTEGALLRLIFEAGLGAINAAVEDIAYASIAIEQAPESAARRREARRRRPSWADEA